jgi:hypothetical protein
MNPAATNPAAARTVILNAEETARPGPDAEYQAFESLTSRLVRVPKDEADAADVDRKKKK